MAEPSRQSLKSVNHHGLKTKFHQSMLALSRNAQLEPLKEFHLIPGHRRTNQSRTKDPDPLRLRRGRTDLSEIKLQRLIPSATKAHFFHERET